MSDERLERQDPRRPDRRQVGHLQVRHEVGQPQQQAQVQDHRRRHRSRRRFGGGHARRARLPGRRLHVPRLAAPGPLDRRPGRHQRRQELPRRRRLASTACSTTRSRAATSGPARATCTAWPRSASTSSTRWSPRVCRSPASTAACSTTARFGGAQVSRTFYARGQTGQQLLLGAYQQLARQIGLGGVRLFNRIELVDTVVIDGRCAGIVTRDLLTGEIQSHAGARRGAGHRRLRQRVLPLHQRDELQRHGGMAGPPTRRLLRQPVLHADPPDVHPAGRRHAVEAHADERVAAQRRSGVGAEERRRRRGRPTRSPRHDRDYYLERLYPSFGNLAPRDISSRAAKRAVDTGRGVGPLKNGVYLDFADAIDRLGKDVVHERYGEPVRDVRAHHRREPVRRADAHLPGQPLHDGRPVGRLRADDHGARPVLPPARPTSATTAPTGSVPRRSCRAWPTATSCCRTRSATTSPRCSTSRSRVSTIPSSRRPRPRPASGSSATSTSRAPARPTGSTASSARSSGTTAAWSAPRRAWRRRSVGAAGAVRASSRRTCGSPATAPATNQTLEKAGRVDDFFQLGMLMCRDALERSESCGGHFRAEYQDEEGEAKRDDEHFAHVAAWEWTGDPMKADPQRRRARVRDRPPRHAELQVMSNHLTNLTLKIWRQTGPDDAGRFESYRIDSDQRRGVVPRDARRAQRAADRRRPRSRSCSTTTAARASAARAR